MATPYKHVGVSSLMGSWPTVPTIGSLAVPSLLPRTLLSKAKIVGARKEPTAGFNVSGQSFYLWVDVAGTPTQFNVAFTGAGNLSLNTVISQINGTPGIPTVASRDNGFLRLESPNPGETSYLRIQTETTSDVLFALGLFAETISRGGDLAPAATILPESQVALPGQLSWMEGESFEARVYNRALFQLGVNADRSEGLLSKKRISVQTEQGFTYATATPAGVTLAGDIYTGDVVTPTVDQLEKWFAVLDADGRELVKENPIVAAGPYADLNFSWDTDQGYQAVTSATAPFLASHATGDYYLKPTTLGTPELNNQLLKIVSFQSPTKVIVSSVDPTTGTRYQVNQAGVTGSIIQVQTVKCQVDGVYDVSGGARIEGVQQTKNVPLASHAVTRVDLSNRVICSGATFVTSGVVVGDLAVWSGHGVSNPYSNNGTYRVSQIIDEETLELATGDWGPAVLNFDVFSAAAGSIQIKTDGMFWKNPFIRFKSNGALPANLQSIKVLCGIRSNLRDATDNPAVLMGNGVRYEESADDTVQKAILAIIGPSATTIDDYLYGNRSSNLERIFNLFWSEHYGDSGRHSNIRPDRINMEPGINGETLTLRNGAGDVGAIKVRLRNSADTLDRFNLTAFGLAGFGTLANGSPRKNVTVPYGGAMAVESITGVGLTGTSFALASTLPADTYYYRVLSSDALSGWSPSSNEVTVVIPAPNVSVVRLRWDTSPGVGAPHRWWIFRKKLSTGTWESQFFGISGLSEAPTTNFFEDSGSGWSAAIIDPTTQTSSNFTAMSTLFGSQYSWIGSDLYIGSSGKAADSGWAPLMIRGDSAYTDKDGLLPGRVSMISAWRPAGTYAGMNAPRFDIEADDGWAPSTDAIFRLVCKRWNGSSWAQKIAFEFQNTYAVLYDATGYDRIYFDLGAASQSGRLVLRQKVTNEAFDLVHDNLAAYLLTVPRLKIVSPLAGRPPLQLGPKVTPTSDIRGGDINSDLYGKLWHADAYGPAGVTGGPVYRELLYVSGLVPQALDVWKTPLAAADYGTAPVGNFKDADFHSVITASSGKDHTIGWACTATQIYRGTGDKTWTLTLGPLGATSLTRLRARPLDTEADAKGLAIAVGSAVSSIYIYTGGSWVLKNPGVWPNTDVPLGAAWSETGTRWTVVGGIGGGADALILNSSDAGTNWTRFAYAGRSNLYDVASNLSVSYFARTATGGAKLLAVGHLGHAYGSVDSGATWVVADCPSVAGALTRVIWDGTYFIAIDIGLGRVWKIDPSNANPALWTWSLEAAPSTLAASQLLDIACISASYPVPVYDSVGSPYNPNYLEKTYVILNDVGRLFFSQNLTSWRMVQSSLGANTFLTSRHYNLVSENGGGLLRYSGEFSILPAT